MAGTAVSNLPGLYKEAYPNGIIPLAPEIAKLYKKLGDLTVTEKTGNKYHQPVITQHEAGVTYGGGALAGTAYALGGSVPMNMADAQLDGSEMTVESMIALRVLSKASSSAKAFRVGMKPIFESNMRTHVTRKEVEILYGRSPTGLGAFNAGVATSATTETITCSAASWAIGIWAGNEGAKINFFNSSGGALISTGADAIFTVTTVDPDNKKLLVTGTSTGCTALHAVVATTDCYPDFAGARTALATYQSAEGIDYVSTVASGTTVWNISNAATLWKPNTYSAGSAKLTLGKVLAAVNKGVAKGGLDEEVDLLISCDTWTDLADSFSATRVTDSSYSTSEGKNGVQKVVYTGANGQINVVIHPMVKAGEGFVVPMARCKKVGSTDVTMEVPSRAGSDMFSIKDGYNAVQFWTYSDWQWFCEKPALMTKITTIVNG